MTGAEKEASISFTASRPELPSASWMSARIRPGCCFLTALHRLAVRAGDAVDLVAERLDQRFDVHGDERLVLDDEHVGRHLLGDLAAGLVDQLADLRLRLAEDLRDLGDGEFLHRHQQEGLPRQRRQRLQPARRAVELVRLVVGLGEVDRRASSTCGRKP